MGYFDQQLGYPTDLLSSRAVIKRNNYAIIPPNGLVCNVIPGFESCQISILATPKLGASFVDYLVTLLEGGKTSQGFGGDGIETFVYVINGQINATAKSHASDEHFSLSSGGYLYCPPDTQLYFENNNHGQPSQLFLYKRRYIAIADHQPYTVCNNVNQLDSVNYEGMMNVTLKDLLPKEIAFDMNIHILIFQPGASHGYIETHLQEHGAYILSGQGMYNLDNQWYPVKKGDYIFMAAYALQACYAVGNEPLSYIYSKDCHRDIDL